MVDFAMDLSNAARSTDGFGDLIMANGDLLLTSDASSHPKATNPILQDIVSRLHTFAGSWFLDTSLGVPYYQEIFGLSVSPTLDTLLQNVVAQTPGVRQIVSWNTSTDRNKRVLTINFTCTTVQGTVSYALGVNETRSQGDAT